MGVVSTTAAGALAKTTGKGRLDPLAVSGLVAAATAPQVGFQDFPASLRPYRRSGYWASLF